MIPPSDQQEEKRPIGFVLNAPIFGPQSPTERVIRLSIRPEDLTHTTPSRAAVSQTLGGAWVDNFGTGLSVINISGHTGWRGGMKEDGLTQFTRLHEMIITRWNEGRAKAINEGLDPDEQCQLLFVDLLSNRVSTVVPSSFTLKRSKSRPLLAQYQITMQVVAAGVPDKEKLVVEKPKEEVLDGAMKVISDIVGKIKEVAGKVAAWIGKNIGEPLKKLMGLVGKVLGMVMDAVNAVKGVMSAITGAVAAIVGIARMITQAVTNIARTISAIIALPGMIKAEIMKIASMFSSAFCALNRIAIPRNLLPDYSAIYGASNCSSTSGGSPLSPLRKTNPFISVAAMGASSPIGVSPAAAIALKRLVVLDPVKATAANTKALTADMSAVTGGVRL